jgi:hypothetical protein
MSKNNIVVDLNKVQYAKLYYRNNKGCCVKEPLPDFCSSANGIMFVDDTPALHHPDYMRETCFDRAKRLGVLDYWEPIIFLQLGSNHGLSFSGDKALSLWKAWNAKIFSQSKKKGK